jgi:hypothetical protein
MLESSMPFQRMDHRPFTDNTKDKGLETWGSVCPQVWGIADLPDIQEEGMKVGYLYFQCGRQWDLEFQGFGQGNCNTTSPLS